MLLVVKGNVQTAIQSTTEHGGKVLDCIYDPRNNSTNVDADISMSDAIQWYCEPSNEPFIGQHPEGTLLWHNDKPQDNHR